MGIEALTTSDSSGAPEQTQQAHRRDYQGQPINAVVVRGFDNRVPATDGTLYLTNGPVSDPFVVFDTSDWRSVIEKGIFQEGKHPWHLARFPKKTQAAVIVHCHFTLLVMALTTAFRLWQAHQTTLLTPESEKPPALSTALLGGEGTARWRLRRKRGEARQSYHLRGRGLCDFPSRRTRGLVRIASATSSLSAWLSSGHS